MDKLREEIEKSKMRASSAGSAVTVGVDASAKSSTSLDGSSASASALRKNSGSSDGESSSSSSSSDSSSDGDRHRKRKRKHKKKGKRKRRHDDSDSDSDDREKKSKSKKSKSKHEKKSWEDEDDDIEGVGKDSLEFKVISWIKGIIRVWKLDLENRPEDEKKSGKGILQTMHFDECKSDIRLLVRLLVKKEISQPILENVVKAIEFVRHREYVRANDVYMKLAIGNARWPIGVTMVGIHARAGRERIESTRVAHIMNSESERRYVTAFKRLITYAQSKYPASEPSKMVGVAGI